MFFIVPKLTLVNGIGCQSLLAKVKYYFESSGSGAKQELENQKNILNNLFKKRDIEYVKKTHNLQV
jgi:hypothetical protein